METFLITEGRKGQLYVEPGQFETWLFKDLHSPDKNRFPGIRQPLIVQVHAREAMPTSPF